MSDLRGVHDLDALPDDVASGVLRSCCGSAAWIEGMLARRPFGTLDALLASADDVWWSLGEMDWLEAFRHHPRIGETASAEPRDERARSWSGTEQAGMSHADAALREDLATANAAYEKKFGYICIICAAGRGAAELLDITRHRLHNDPPAEARIAAAEQAQITTLRLQKLFVPMPGVSR